MQYEEDNQLFADLYRCITAPSHWVSVLDQVKARMNVASVVVQVIKKQYSGTVDLEWEVRDSFSLEHSALHDKWVNNADNPRLLIEVNQPLQVVRDVDVFEEDCPVFRGFQKRLALAGLGKAIMLDIALPNDTLLSLIAHRHSHDDQPYDADIEQFLYALAPHLSQALEISQAFKNSSCQQHLLESIVDHISMGLLLIDEKGGVLWGSQTAENMIQSSAVMTLHNQHLRFLNSSVNHSFRDILSRFTDQSSGFERHILVVREECTCTLEIMLTPFHNKGALPYALVYLKDMQSATLIDPKEVQILFSLTPAEANIAVALADGLTLSEYAGIKGISIGTTRIQLKSVFAKMGINRQAELVRKLYSSVSMPIQ